MLHLDGFAQQGLVFLSFEFILVAYRHRFVAVREIEWIE